MQMDAYLSACALLYALKSAEVFSGGTKYTSTKARQGGAEPDLHDAQESSRIL